MKIEPNKKYYFDIKFEEQLKRAIGGYAPWKENQYQARAMSNMPPSIAQLKLLKDLSCELTPSTMSEASALISSLKSKV